MSAVIDRSAVLTAERSIQLHFTGDGGYLMLYRLDELHGEAPVFDQQFEVEQYLLRFLQIADGTRTYGEIEEVFVSDYGELFGPALCALAAKAVTELRLCTVSNLPKANAGGVARVSGSEQGYHPIHATFEIIETCNFSCSHCYYSSSPLKKNKVSLDDAFRVMDLLAQRGVRVLELTGGECTVHPDFKKILAHASETFVLVAVISNGYLLGTRSGLLDYVASFSNVVVQISIDGLEEYHDKWRRHSGSFRAACTAIRGLAQRGVAVRMASAISQNIDEVAPLFRLAKHLGAAAVAFSPIAALGRGCNVAEPGHGAEAIVKAINAQLDPFKEDPLLRKGDPVASVGRGEPPRNCGAGSRTYAVDYNGDVRACNFSRDSKQFGNILSQPYESIFGQKANFQFRNAPSPGGDECAGCRYYFYCRGCFVKAFMVSESEYPECPWRQKWFEGMSLKREVEPTLPGRKVIPLLPERKPIFEHCGCKST